MNIRLPLCAVLLAAVSSAVAAAPPATRDAAPGAGARLLSQPELIETLRGNTLQGPDYALHYAADGAKLMRRADGSVTRLRWWIGADGAFCEDSLLGRPSCAPQRWLLGEELLIFGADGALKYALRVVPGAPAQP